MVTFMAPNLGREITISGNANHKAPEGSWIASEIEYTFKNNLTTKTIDKIDRVKKLFNGKIVMGKVN